MGNRITFLIVDTVLVVVAAVFSVMAWMVQRSPKESTRHAAGDWSADAIAAAACELAPGSPAEPNWLDDQDTVNGVFDQLMASNFIYDEESSS